MDLHTEGKSTFRGNDISNYRNHLKLPLTNAKKVPKRLALSLQTPQVLSPLILSPCEDTECAGGPFLLEDPLFEEGFHRKGKQSGKGGRRRLCKGDTFHGACLGRLHVGETDLLQEWRSQNHLISSASTSKRTSQRSNLCAWEVSSGDDLDNSDRPQNLHVVVPYILSKDKKEQSNTAGYDRKGRESTKESFSSSQNGFEISNLDDLYATEPITHGPQVINDDELCSVEGRCENVSGIACNERRPKCRYVKKSVDKAAGSPTMASESSFPPPNGMELTVFVDQPSRSLSQKYRPKLFEELVGQDLVTQALSSAVLKEKIAPVYLFHGSRGTGKTSAARILAAALNCLMISVEMRPCTFCSQCKALASGSSSGVCWEVDAASHSDVSNVWTLLQNSLSTSSSSRYKVFIIDECHMLSVETWNALLKFLEEPPGDFVFILVTTDPDKLPRTASSRCQKFAFMKIKHVDILRRLSKLVALERLDVEYGALDIIASRSDGSLRDAEMTLDQLSLCEKTITPSAVLDLVGSVSDEKVLHLLDLALGPDTVSTVRKAKELVDSGIEPLDLMTRLARLITDILAGSYKFPNQDRNQFVSRHTHSKEGLDGLSVALKILSEAEKQLTAAHHDRMAWLTAALLQFGRHRGPKFLPLSSASASASATTSPRSRKSPRNMKFYESGGVLLPKWVSTRNILNKMSPYSDHGSYVSVFKPKARLSKPNLEPRIHPTVYPFSDDATSGCSIDSSEACASPLSGKESSRHASFLGPGNLGSIWHSILRGCKSLPLRHLLSHGRLLGVCFSTVEALVHLEFKDPEQKSRAERYEKVIANTCKKGLGLSVNVKISLAPQPVKKGSLSPPEPLLLEKRFTAQQCFVEEPKQAFRLEHGIRVEPRNASEVASLQHRTNQSGIHSQLTLEHSIFLNSSVAMSPLTSKTCGSLNAYEGLLEAPNLGKFYERCQASNNLLCYQLPPSRGYDGQHESPVPTENGNTGRYLDIVTTNADGLQTQKQVHGSASPGYEAEKSNNVDEETLRFKSQPKFRGLLCWRMPKAEEGKLQVGGQGQRRSCGSLITFMPCAAKATSD